MKKVSVPVEIKCGDVFGRAMQPGGQGSKELWFVWEKDDDDRVVMARFEMGRGKGNANKPLPKMTVGIVDLIENWTLMQPNNHSEATVVWQMPKDWSKVSPSPSN